MASVFDKIDENQLKIPELEIERLEAERAAIERQIEELNLNEAERKIEIKKYGMDAEDLTRIFDLNELHGQLELIDVQISEMDPGYFVKKIMDKKKVLKNFRYLLEKSGCKIGNIERESGNAKGYVSRLEKEGNKSYPNMEFLLTASRKFDVSLDLLVNGNLSELSLTEVYVIKFLSNLIKDTRNDVMIWEKRNNAIYTSLPVHEQIDEKDMVGVDLDGQQYYRSIIDPDSVYVTKGKTYSATIPGSEDKIYISCAGAANANEIDNKYMFYEVYFVAENGEVSAICNTSDTCDTVGNMVKNLYREIQVADSHVHINDRAKGIMEQYMRRNR